MKTLFPVLLFCVFMISTGASMSDATTVYDFTMKDIDGKDVALSSYRGKVMVIVNVASECGYTPQYQGLQALYDKYKDRGLVVLGFPANNFGAQEPGTESQIKIFCSEKYHVNFPMFSKISAVGHDIHPLYAYLSSDHGAASPAADIRWNFEKFIVSKSGQILHHFRSRTTPESDEFIHAVEDALK